MKNPLNQLKASLPAKTTRNLKVRLLLLLVFTASVALVWWSINRLPDWEQKLKQTGAQVAGMESEILQLDMRWNAQEAEQIAAGLKDSEEQLLSGREEVNAWQTNLQRRADQFTLVVSAGVTRTQDCPLPGKRFSIFAATLDVSSITPGQRTNSPYLRLLNFAQNLSGEKKRVDLLEVNASGNSNSVSKATLGLQLWSLENTP